MAFDQLRAREYVRVSLDRSGRERSVEEQHTENAQAAAREGWNLLGQYRDNSVSASRYTQKARTGFAEMMADLEEGRFEADVLIVWESSRGSRRAGEWVDLIDVCAEQGVLIHITKDEDTYDPRRGKDRKALLSEAIDGEYESSKVSERTKRSNAASAAAGRPHGRVAYGFQRVYDPHSGALLGQEPHPSEAPVVRELFARIVAGHSLRGIARDFEQRGVVTRGGKPFSGAGLRSLAVKDAYAGRRVHDPGRTGGTAHTPHAQFTPATWEPLVSEADFLTVSRILSDPTRRTNRPGRGVHLLSMIAVCDVCGGPLAATNRDNRGEQYQCHRAGHVRVSKPELDHVAVGRISSALTVQHLDDDPGSTDESEAARADVEKIRSELDDLAAALAGGAVTVATVSRAEPGILARLRAAETVARDLATPPRLRGLVPDSLLRANPGPEFDDEWDALAMSVRREIARVLLVPGRAGALRVMRSPTPGRARTQARDRVFWQKVS